MKNINFKSLGAVHTHTHTGNLIKNKINTKKMGVLYL